MFSEFQLTLMRQMRRDRMGYDHIARAMGSDRKHVTDALAEPPYVDDKKARVPDVNFGWFEDVGQ